MRVTSFSTHFCNKVKSYAILACGDRLDEAAESAADAAIEAIMRPHSWSFEKAYAFGSLVVDLKINQAVDLKKGSEGGHLKKLPSP